MSERGRMVGAIVSAVVGGVIAAVTLVGIVLNGVNSPSDKPGNVNAGVPYGSTQ